MLNDLLTLGGRWSFVGGKGGVGKTTTAAALALGLAEGGEPVLVISFDPAHSLGDALGVPLGPTPGAVPGVRGLEALEVDAEHERKRFLATNRGALLRLIERGTYLDEADVAGFIELTVPGVDELAALLWLLDLAARDDRRVIIDTAPTGHTLRLLELPTLARGWLAALEAMEEKHAAVASALAGRVPADEVTELLSSLRGELDRLDTLLRDPERTRFVLVSTAEPVVLAETRRYQEVLERAGIAPGGVVINRARTSPADAVGGGMVFVPPLRAEPHGIDGLRTFSAAAARTVESSPPPWSGSARLRLAGGFTPPANRTLHLVGGKGGVGKSTVACALAVRLARSGRGRVLLLGTDPAGSLGDVLGVPVSGEPRRVPAVPGLEARELDAAAVWAAFREEYRAEAERLFAGLLGGMSATADLRVVERLIDLAPPGIDELMALLEVVELLEAEEYDALVLDTAPTGHLLRLLELPGVALEWAHTLLRLLLKYREVVGLGRLAERVLRLSRSLRDLRTLLSDPARCWFLVVALPEALSVPETERLLHRLRELEIPLGALLVNRALLGDELADPHGRVGALLAGAPHVAHVVAPRLDRGPTGADALDAFAGGWRLVAGAAPGAPREPGSSKE